MLRRLKHDTTIDLKPKREVHVYCPMSDMQRTLIRKLLFSKREDGKSTLNNLIMQLRKAAIHPYLFPEWDTEPDELGRHIAINSGKFLILDQMLDKFVTREKKKILVFSQFTSALNILEDLLAYKGVLCYRLDGQTPVISRNKFMEEFNSEGNQVRVFILSTRTGGLGINLAAASIVIILDSDWNPQMDLQAMDRAHRMGQKQDVTVYRLITRDSVEEKIIERQVIKLKYDFLLLEKARHRKKDKN